MQPEQQQRIMGYFIEEAKDHLNTIEQGLLNLQGTLDDSEMANELFRAAHSVKGGAAMLGLGGIQQTSHKLEDYFKILKETPSIRVDQKLETLLLQVFDTLNGLLEQLQTPFGLTEEVNQSALRDANPVFAQVDQHLQAMIASANPTLVGRSTSPSSRSLVFQEQVPAKLREMLDLFKQIDTNPSLRSNLQRVCADLRGFGETFALTNWISLLELTERAVLNPENSGRVLAGITLKDLKQAQAQILSDQDSAIAASDALVALAPLSAEPLVSDSDDDFSSLFDGDDLESDLGFDSDTSDLLDLGSLESDDFDLFADTDLSAASSIDDLELDGLELDGLQLDDFGLGDFDLPTGDVDASLNASDNLGGIDDLETLDDFQGLGDLDELDFGDLQDDDLGLGILEAEQDQLETSSQGTSATEASFRDLMMFGDSGPEMGLAELNSLADLFEGEVPDLSSTWQVEEEINNSTELSLDDLGLQADSRSDRTLSSDSMSDDALNDLFGSALVDDAPTPLNFDFDLSDDDSLLGDSLDLERLGLDDLGLDTPEDLDRDTSSSFSDLGDLFGELDEADLQFDPSLDAGPEPIQELELEGFKFDDDNDNDDDSFSSLFIDGDSALASSASTVSDLGEMDSLFGDVPYDLDVPVASASDTMSLDGNDFSGLEDDPTLLDLTDQDTESDIFFGMDEPILLDSLESETEMQLDPNLNFGSTDDLDNDWILPETDLDSDLDSDLDLSSDLGLDSDLDLDLGSDLGLDLDSDLDLSSDLDLGLDSDLDLGSELSDSFDSDFNFGEGLVLDNSSSDALAFDDLLDEDDFLDENVSLDAFDLDIAETSELDLDIVEDDVWGDVEPLSSDADSLNDLFGMAAIGIGGVGAMGVVSAMQNPTSTDSDVLDTVSSDDVWDDDLWGDTSLEMPSSNIASSTIELENLSESDDLSELEIHDDDMNLDDMNLETINLDDMSLESSGVDDMSLDDMDLGEVNLDQMDLGEMNLDNEFTSMSLDSNDDIWGETDNNLGSDFDDLDSLLGDSDNGFGLDSIGFEESEDNLAANDDGSFSDLDDFLSSDQSSSLDLDFAGMDDFTGAAVLGTGLVAGGAIAANAFGSQFDDDPEFGDLEKLLEDRDLGSSSAPIVPGAVRPVGTTRRPAARPSKGLGEQTMRVPVKHLDNLSNLVGELVVNRNSLEQDQERMRQSLDNLLYQVQQLSDVGQRMQDLYERSLLESSLLASRQSYRMASSAPRTIVELEKTNDVEYDPLEMDRFTGFHSLSQEMIELIVRVRESASDIEFIVDETDQVTRMFRQVTTQLQEGLTRSRMVPFAQTADRMPRAVRDIAMKCGKQAELVIEGRETPIDKMLLEHLYDPMTHLVNNAITHGIETPEERRRAGKSDTGRITIRAFYQGNQTVISVSDDGAGIDIERVKVKAIEKGLISAAESQTMSRLDVYDLLFHPGFTTRDQADDFAGRGVGMDVVRTSLSEIRGSVTTDSTLNRGTTFTVRLPLTLSISKALCCVSDRARIAFPMDGVEDMLDMPKDRLLINAEGQPYIRWRDSELVLRPLTELLAHNRHLGRGNVYGGNQEEDMISVVVLRSVGNYLALQVDQVIGEQEIVIKQLEGPVPKPVGIAGATVLGDGRIMPIADVLELIDLSMGHIRRDAGSMWDQNAMPPQEIQPAKTEPMVLIVDDSITVRELLSMTFNKVGYRVEQARDGQEAWEKLRAGLPCDIVFCDIEMPRMDGLELLSRIQKDPVLKALPIAMLTSRGADRHRQMASSLGASGYFTKPYLEEALLDAAGRMLKGEVLLANDRSE